MQDEELQLIEDELEEEESIKKKKKRRSEWFIPNKLSDSNKIQTILRISILWLTLVSGLVAFLLWMNGTIGSASSTTNYQYNTTGIGLTVLLGLIGLIVISLLCFYYLVWSGCPTFTQKQLELIIEQAILRFLEKPDDPIELFRMAQKAFTREVIDDVTVSKEDLIKRMRTRLLLAFIEEQINENFPYLAIRGSKWAFQEVGSVWARQKLNLANFREYGCEWGVERDQSGFSGHYTRCNEGDIAIIGTFVSYDPEAENSVPRTYMRGKTSRLYAGTRRVYDLRIPRKGEWDYELFTGCWMYSFALWEELNEQQHKRVKTNMAYTAWTGLFLPYWFHNNDSKSFKIQLHDALHGMCLWVNYRLRGGN